MISAHKAPGPDCCRENAVANEESSTVSDGVVHDGNDDGFGTTRGLFLSLLREDELRFCCGAKLFVLPPTREKSSRRSFAFCEWPNFTAT